ncbi:hypothetical protein PAXRUDRAFT_833765 [Paxillus rubicundulus Ve08.2h10]|uniref:Uncharacterized protein n=1 Tax=Paxillus rubicundulus Ve08.2h10 TaxID=930991 RepID=A0A0D0CB19_9AGAM|nr:hypothetical protein PAXRUDRAFT_833765 [Paxillus rubicundulus Ve08.2h10]
MLPRSKFDASRSMLLSRATSSRGGGQGEASASGGSQLRSSRRLHWTVNLRSIPLSLRRLPVPWKDFSSSRGSPTRMGTPTLATTSELISRTAGDQAEPQVVLIQQSPSSPKVYHPSDVINQLLLDSEPLANVVVTHDNEWMSVFEKNPLIQEDKMIEDICTRFHVEYEDNASGFAYLHKHAEHPLYRADETPALAITKRSPVCDCEEPKKPVVHRNRLRKKGKHVTDPHRSNNQFKMGIDRDPEKPEFGKLSEPGSLSWIV